MLQKTENNEVVRLRLPVELRLAIQALALRDFTSASAIIRQAVADRVRREGLMHVAGDGHRKS